jgi:hypothetical protein
VTARRGFSSRHATRGRSRRRSIASSATAALRERLAGGALAWAARFRWEDAAAAVGETLDAACGRVSAPHTTAAALSLTLRAPGGGQ